ncbi:hypothetical protein [Streptomyces griseosporeus]|uniref:hypothetical protein n=1 Tax=Streptomyces griseosporeus TaxID=1910 RepID=UPI00167EEC11|nr:hypothetical protein [Streptomyces griseosporeus]
MHSEPAIENRAPARGRRRKRAAGSAEGPVFVDNSGRRAKLLRRLGLLVGAVCLGYAAVLVMAFMGWGTSLTPSSLLPFDAAGGQRGQAPGGFRPEAPAPAVPTASAPAPAVPTASPSVPAPTAAD